MQLILFVGFDIQSIVSNLLSKVAFLAQFGHLLLINGHMFGTVVVT